MLAAVPVAADDPAFDEPVVAAHVPLPGSTRGAGCRVGATYDPDDEVAALKPGTRGRLHHLA